MQERMVEKEGEEAYVGSTCGRMLEDITDDLVITKTIAGKVYIRNSQQL